MSLTVPDHLHAIEYHRQCDRDRGSTCTPRWPMIRGSCWCTTRPSCSSGWSGTRGCVRMTISPACTHNLGSGSYTSTEYSTTDGGMWSASACAGTAETAAAGRPLDCAADRTNHGILLTRCTTQNSTDEIDELASAIHKRMTSQ